MSTPLSFLQPPDDSREVELIRSLLEKTRLGKIPWTKQGNAITATIPTGLQINFVLSPASILGAAYSGWQLLTVRDKSGGELVRVSNNNMVSLLVGATTSSLVEAADELFKAVNVAADDKLDRAIDAIKKL